MRKKLLIISLSLILFIGKKIVAENYKFESEDERRSILIHPVHGEPDLERIILIFRKIKSKDKQLQASDQDPTYKLISGGLKFENLPVSYEINDNGNFDHFPAVVNAFEEWDSYTSKELFSSPTSTFAGSLERDNHNTVSWQPLSRLFGSDVVAVTQLIYNTKTKRMIEFDIALNSDLSWSVDGNPYAFDVQNVVTHEVGHVVSLADLYAPKTSELTMYGYTTEGEVKKRTLGRGDIIGLQKVYGE